MIPLADLAVITLASGRVAYSISQEEIFRPLRNWIFLRSAPVDAEIVLRREDGDEVWPARMVRDTLDGPSLEPNLDLRKPGFVGSAVSCPYCLSFWTSLAMILAYLALGHVVAVALTPLAVWAGATAAVRWLT